MVFLHKYVFSTNYVEPFDNINTIMIGTIYQVFDIMTTFWTNS